MGIIELLSKYDPFLATHIEKYGSKGHGSTSYLSHSICDELINIIAKSVTEVIVKEAQCSRYFSISVDSTPDITHTDQLCITIRYVLPYKRFVTFVPIRSHTGLGIAEVILNFLEENAIDIKNCRGQSYDNANNMSGKYKGVQQRIKDVCGYAEFCPCFAHSLNLVGSCAVKANTAAANFFSIIQQLYMLFSSSTHLWEKLEDMLKNSAAMKPRLLVVKRLSETRWSARYDAVRALALGYNEYAELLKVICDDEENHGEVRNEAKGLVEKLSQLETCILFAVWKTVLERFQQTSSALQKEGIDLNTAVHLLESLHEYVQGFRDRHSVFEDEAKEISRQEDYARDNRRRRQRKRFPQRNFCQRI